MNQKFSSRRDEVTYAAESSLRIPRVFLRSMVNDLSSCGYIAWRLFVRDIQVRYRQTALGYLWVFAPPLIAAGGLMLASEGGIINIAKTDIPYPVYVILSMALWQTFTEAMNGPIQAIAEAKAMLGKINFPREALVIAKIGDVFFSLLIKIILVVVVFAWFDIGVTWKVIFAPFAILSLVVFGTLCGLAVAPLAALYQDVGKTVSILTTGWLLLTPVLYPTPQNSAFAEIVRLNPVTPLLVTARELITTGSVSGPISFLVVTGCSVIVLLVTWVIFRLAIPFIAERISG
jgi:lipopolysaccharide transport system permease protein